MDNLDTVVNTNENVIYRQAYTRPDETGTSQEYLLPFIPTARAMIKKYSPRHEWKHFLNHHEYIFNEWRLCTILCNRIERKRAQRIDLYAWILEVSPLLLFNDFDIV